MAVAGIIAEYNPFHRGHAWQLAELRRRLGEGTGVVAVMSGNFVQRGDFAILEKHARAEMALRGGADLVLELPTPWACATAERFAWGGVSLLAATGVVTHLAFGSETGEASPLLAAAECLDGEAYPSVLGRFLGEGVSFAAARQAAVRTLAGEAADCLSRPNDNLAVEYLRALRRVNGEMEPLALPRVGEGHDSDGAGEYPSASAIRRRVLAGEAAEEELLPGSSFEVLARERAAGRGPVTAARCERAVLSRLRRLPEEAYRSWDGGKEGLYHRFYDAVRRGASLEGILAAVKTKRYSLARLRRLALHAYLDVTVPGREETPPYLRVLGANGRGRSLLRQMEKTAARPVVTKPAYALRLGGAAEALMRRESGWTDLYTLAYPALSEARPGEEFRHSPVML